MAREERRAALTAGHDPTARDTRPVGAVARNQRGLPGPALVDDELGVVEGGLEHGGAVDVQRHARAEEHRAGQEDPQREHGLRWRGVRGLPGCGGGSGINGPLDRPRIVAEPVPHGAEGPSVHRQRRNAGGLHPGL